MRLEEATILVVDDELELLEIFGRWLGREGCRVLTAPNGAEALKVLETEKIDVLVSDIRMPVMGGVALVRTLYDRKITVPSIIFVSGYGDVEAREMYGLGVEMLIEKPLNRKALLRALEDSVKGRDELWRTPSAEPMAQSVYLELDSLARAMSTCTFQLGHGGCCIASGLPLEEKTIDLSIRFVQDGLLLRAQGTVRWHEKFAGRAGVSFDHLEEECREWVIDTMRTSGCRSFIPQCRRGASHILGPGNLAIIPASPELVCIL
jgi:CheY-like chemotaxis protein